MASPALQLQPKTVAEVRTIAIPKRRFARDPMSEPHVLHPNDFAGLRIGYWEVDGTLYCKSCRTLAHRHRMHPDRLACSECGAITYTPKEAQVHFAEVTSS